MPLYVGDFLADTMHLGATETGIYIRLIMHCWQHGSIPLNNRKLALIAHCDTRLWHQYRETVLQFFDVVNASTAQHKRVSTELQRYAELSNKRKASAEQVHKKKRASAVQVHPQSQSPSPRDIEPSGSISQGSAWPPDYREQFWNAYPQNGRVAKSKAIAKLDAIRKSRKVEWDPLFAGVLRYAAAANPNYTKHALTWLTGGCWDDDPAAIIRGKGNGKQDTLEMVSELADECREREREIEQGLFRPPDHVRGR